MSVARKSRGGGKKSATFYMTIRVNGERIVKNTHCTTERDAKAFERKWRAENLGGQSAEQLTEQLIAKKRKVGDYTFLQAIEKHKGTASVKSGKKPSLKKYREDKNNFKEFEQWCVGRSISKPLLLTEDDARDYVAHVLDRDDIKQTTKRIRISSVKRVYTAILGPDKQHNPWRNISTPKAGDSPRGIFNSDQIAKLIADGSDEGRPVYIIGAHTGLRPGDIYTLRWTDVDLAAGLITRVCNKTAYARRPPVQVPILPPVRALLLQQQGKHPVWVLPEHAEKYNQIGENGSYNGRMTLSHNLNYDIRRVLAVDADPDRFKGKRGDDRPSGYPALFDQTGGSLDLYALRHTFIWEAFEHECSLPTVQGYVGHGCAAVTAIYTKHQSRESALRNAQKLPVYGALHIDDAIDISAREVEDLTRLSDEQIEAQITRLQAELDRRRPKALPA